jgi:hypothetical protein
MNNEQLRYKGYQNTPTLWNDSLLGLDQFDIPSSNQSQIKEQNKKLRLGLLVEQFVFASLINIESTKIIGTNIQVIQDKKTIGELDCLILEENKPLHIEIVYKFYLYDSSIPGAEIDKWIGPNRNDSLKQKLTKLKAKQMPLLHHPRSIELINDLGYNSKNFDQRVHFKAQLFIPLGQNEQIITEVNSSCIRGTYITLKELGFFVKNDFFIPAKLDWLIDPHPDVIWLSYSEYLAVIEKELNRSRSPLCWMKDCKGNITKLFVVFW